MPDTDTRSVAELMGWQVIPGHDNDDGSRTMTTYTRPDAEVVWCGEPRPTPDDMLAWLLGQGCSVGATTSVGTSGRTFNVWFRPRGKSETKLWNTTLHAALEAAVKVVARGE